MTYDCMEDKQLHLNEDNLLICCGLSMEFHRIEIAGELKKSANNNQNDNWFQWHI